MAPLRFARRTVVVTAQQNGQQVTTAKLGFVLDQRAPLPAAGRGLPLPRALNLNVGLREKLPQLFWPGVGEGFAQLPTLTGDPNPAAGQLDRFAGLRPADNLAAAIDKHLIASERRRPAVAVACPGVVPLASHNLSRQVTQEGVPTPLLHRVNIAALESIQVEGTIPNGDNPYTRPTEPVEMLGPSKLSNRLAPVPPRRRSC
jgi:hypothetical protein